MERAGRQVRDYDEQPRRILNRPELGHTPLRDPLRQKCYYPFFKMFVDFDGTVFFCSNDWGRTTPIGNVMQASVRDLWLSPKLKQIRERLSGSDRSVHPCSACDVNGMLHGKHSFDILTKYYGIAPCRGLNVPLHCFGQPGARNVAAPFWRRTAVRMR